jgi:hypothetical protein
MPASLKHDDSCSCMAVHGWHKAACRLLLLHKCHSACGQMLCGVVCDCIQCSSLVLKYTRCWHTAAGC